VLYVHGPDDIPAHGAGASAPPLPRNRRPEHGLINHPVQDRERASREVKHLALEHVSELDRKIAELTAIRNAIADLAERCHGDDRPDCPILDELEATAH
jgi:hypothetical protein